MHKYFIAFEYEVDGVWYKKNIFTEKRSKINSEMDIRNLTDALEERFEATVFLISWRKLQC